MAMDKTFVIDTNVLLHNPSSIHSFGKNWVVIPLKVIEELDAFKRNKDELGVNARTATRLLDSLRYSGEQLSDGVDLPSGGKLRVAVTSSTSNGHFPLEKEIGDNAILRAAWDLSQQGQNVTFVSKDLNARIKAGALNLHARDFEKQVVDVDHLYEGHGDVPVSFDVLNKFFADKTVPLPEGNPTITNQYVMLRSGEGIQSVTALGRVDAEGMVKTLSAVSDATRGKQAVWGIQALNREQQYALDCLMDPSVQLVSLLGGAGTGKTLVALAAGLHQVVDMRLYRRVLVSRPVIPMGRDIGYLPGDKDEKLRFWMLPIYDNLEFLFSRNQDDTSPVKPEAQIQYLRDIHALELEAMTYIRGRSIAKQFLIVDEAQNLTPHEVKTVISRAGDGTKIVLTGDPEQIDNPYLDRRSNGLSYLVDRFKGQAVYAHVTLKKSERSELAGLAADLL